MVSTSTITLSCPGGTAQVGVAYSSALGVTGGAAPYTFSIIGGTLPPGLSLNSSTGAIAGAPSTAGTYNFTAKVVDSQGNAAMASCSIVVSAPTLTLSCPAGAAQVGVAYSSALTAAGGQPPYTFSITTGTLPAGLTLNPSTGAITGTPTTSGTFTFTSQVADSRETTASASCSIMVSSAGLTATSTTLTLVPSNVPVGSAGPVVMTATVVPLSGSGTPTGTVTYFNGSTQIGTATLSGGVATFNYNPSGLAIGIYSITAVYSGDSMFAASSSPTQTLAITQTGPFAYVADNGSNTVSLVNIPTGQVLSNIPVGSGPWGTAISPDQTHVYVSNNQSNNVSVIDTASGSVVATIPVQSSPFGLAFSPDGSSVYVVNGSSNTVSVINTVSQSVVATVTVGNSPVSVAMAPTSNGTFAYVTNSGSNTVSVIAVTSSPTVVQTIPVGTGPRWVTITPNSSTAYVENAGSNNVSVISVANNQVTGTISVGTSPFGAAVTPDNSTLYVANSGSNNVSVIDTKSGVVFATVPGFNSPVQVALTTDGASAYVTNLNANTVSVIATASNTISGTVQVGSAPIGITMAAAPQLILQITQPLSPTQQNTFNFGSNAYAVQYPPNTQFSNVNMTITSVEITQAQFQQRVAGTQFASASCIVYGGGAGNCIDDEVTCSDNNGNPISCPSEPQPTIAVQTSFSTGQAIINPGYLTTPIGQNAWQNIFSGFSDPTVRGKTQGFSEFIAVDLGITNPQGKSQFTLLHPKLPRKYSHGEVIPIVFHLTSVVTGKPVTGAKAGLSVVM
ncbi:MAG: putative Ig domain-containing protein, partial [Terriglobales bacterium]